MKKGSRSNVIVVDEGYFSLVCVSFVCSRRREEDYVVVCGLRRISYVSGLRFPPVFYFGLYTFVALSRGDSRCDAGQTPWPYTTQHYHSPQDSSFSRYSYLRHVNYQAVPMRDSIQVQKLSSTVSLTPH